MKRRAWILVAALCASCSKPESGPDPRERLLSSWWNDVLAPELTRLGDETSALSDRVEGFCATPSGPSLDAARSQFAHAHSSLKRQEVFAFGPYVEEPLRFKTRLDFWPARPDTIEQTIADETVNLDGIDILPGPAKGLPVIEYLLFTTDAGDLTAFEGRRCDYLQAIADQASDQSRALYDAWNPADGGYYSELLNPGTGDYDTIVVAVSAVINRLWFTVENIRLMKLGDPLGSGTPQPELVEAPYAPRSIAAIEDNLDMIELLYFGDEQATGIAEFVPDEDAPLNAEIETALIDSRAALTAIESPLTVAIGERPELVQAAIDELGVLQRLIEVDAISALGLSLSFNDNDGD